MEYRTLRSEDREIRLLTLLEGSNSATVSCTLEHVSLFDPPAYTALSYCWGNPDITKTILVNGVKCQATINLEASLRQLHASGYSKVWADALCINQCDRDERSLQVNMMKTIYSRASGVVAWLGVETPESKIAMGYMRDQLEDDLLRWTTQLPASDTAAFQDTPPAMTLDDNISKAISSLFNRPYWKRVWILQEVVAAKGVAVFCGSISLDMARIETLLKITAIGKSLLRDGSAPAFGVYRKDPASDSARPLITLLMASRASLATDPRDKVFALLGLSTDGQEIIPLPNYKKSLELTFREICVSILTLKGCLGIISLRSGLEEQTLPNLPSWVPDWGSLSSAMRPWHPWVFRNGDPLSRLTENTLGPLAEHIPKVSFPAKEAKNQPFRFLDGTSHLSLKGVPIDTIDGISTPFQRCDKVCGRQCNSHGMKQPRFQRSPYESDEQTVVAIACSLAFAQVDFQASYRQEAFAMFTRGLNPLTYLRFFNKLNTTAGRQRLREANNDLPRWIAENKLLQIDGRSFRSWIKEPVDKISVFQWEKDIFHSLVETVLTAMSDVNESEIPQKQFADRLSKIVGNGMRLVVTCKGWVGMAHPHAKQGDFICKVLGCPLPLILRKSKNGYRVVGEGYLHPIEKFGFAEEIQDLEEFGRLVDITLE